LVSLKHGGTDETVKMVVCLSRLSLRDGTGCPVCVLQTGHADGF